MKFSQYDRTIITDNTFGQLETPLYEYSIIDAPGHRDFLKNTINSISQSDVALLLVAAVHQEFEAGFSDGQTKLHILLAYTFGIKQIIIGINKMDDKKVNYGRDRFEEIQNQLNIYLKKVGYDPTKIPFVPISALQGDNLIELSTNMT